MTLVITAREHAGRHPELKKSQRPNGRCSAMLSEH